MANPQPDKFTKISNEIMDNLAKIRIAGEARQMLDVIIRKTYGFNKKEDKISTSQFMELTGLSRIAIPKARKKLLKLNLITISQKGYSQGLIYSIQKDYEKWKPYPKKDTVKVMSKIKHKTLDNEENKRSKNPSFSGRECEICGQKEDNNEYVFHSHHVKWQLDKKRNIPVSDKSSPTILVCWLCHQKIHKSEIKINYNPKRTLSPFLVTECIQKSTKVYPKKDTNCIPKSSTQKKERQYTKETIQKKERFNEIYKSYPNRDSKKKAEEHFNASVKAEKDWQDINTALVKYKKHLAIETWLKPKSASTWFYNWRDWVDYIEPQKTSQKFIPISEQIKIEREQERKQKEVIC